MPVRSTGRASCCSPATAAGSGASGAACSSGPGPWSVVTVISLLRPGGLGLGASQKLAGRRTAARLAEHGVARSRADPRDVRRLGEGEPAEPRLLQFFDLRLAVGAELHVLDLVVQLDDRVQQHLRAGRA